MSSCLKVEDWDPFFIHNHTRSVPVFI